MLCPSCNGKVVDGATECEHCGHQFDSSAKGYGGHGADKASDQGAAIKMFLETFNGKVWVALVLFVASCIMNLFGNVVLSAVSAALGGAAFGFMVWDFVWLKSAGNRPRLYTLVIYPWYVWKKNKINPSKTIESDRALVKLFAGAMALWLLTTYLGMSNGYESDMAKASIPIVTQIIHSNVNASVDCVDVSDVKKIGPSLYSGKALLTTGKSVDITIQSKDNGMIYVTIPK